MPKASVISYDGFAEWWSGIVHFLEEEEGILGREYRAYELEVKILAVGDDEVIVSGLEDYENTRGILNLSIR